jgi:hypothetical protein
MRRNDVHLTTRDRWATAFVATAALTYLFAVLTDGSTTTTEVRAATGVVLALGLAASVSAVVPGFDALLHGSKAYMVVASLLGAGALASGIVALVNASEPMLALLVACTVILWAISTVRHSLAASADVRPTGESPALG